MIKRQFFLHLAMNSKGVLCCLLLWGLGGCQSAIHVERESHKYRSHEPLYFCVKSMDVVNSYVAPKKEPYVDHLMPYSLDDELVEWAHHRLRPGFKEGYGVVVIEKASIKRHSLPQKKGLISAFTRQESDEYEAHGAVRIDFMDHKGYPIGSVFADSKHTQTVLEKTTPEELQTVWSELSRRVVDDLSHQIEKNIRQQVPKLLQ